MHFQVFGEAMIRKSISSCELLSWNKQFIFNG